jgi:VWFA-related protein
VRRRRAALAAVLACLAVVLVPAAGTAQEGRFGEKTSVVVVEVPVNVVKDGKPLRGLTAGDFEVFEGKERQKIVAFEVVDLPAFGGTASEPSKAVPFAARRHFLLLFDLTFAEPKSIVLAREAALELVRKGLHPSDLVAVATYSAAHGTDLVLGFTADREQAVAAIESLGLPQLLDRAPDPLRLVVAAAESELAMAQAGQRRRAEALARLVEDLKETQRQGEVHQGRAAQNQVVALTRSFTDLAGMMASVDGRKHVVYLSEGFNAAAGSGRGSDRETAAEVAEGETWNADSEMLYGSTRVQNDVERMLEAFRRADCVIQAVDIGGVAAAGADVGQVLVDLGEEKSGGRDALLTMARDTGGDLYQNTNDLSVAMGKMLERTGVTYLLTVQPTALVSDGAYHPLKVRLTNGPRGARVQHRAGYYAPDPRRPQSPVEQRLAIAAEILGGDEGGAIPFSVLAVPKPAPGPVPLVVELAGPALLRGHSGPSLGLEIYAYALDRDSAVRAYLTQRVDVELAKVGAALNDSGLKFYGALDLPPGEYTLRVLVRDAGTGAQGLRSVPLTVPAAAAGPLVLPALFSDAAPWILARQERRTEGAEPPAPLTLGGQPFLPSARPVLAPGGAAPVALLVYNLGGEQAQVRATVLDAGGHPVAGGKLSIRAFRRGTGGEPGELEGSFSTAGLAPGDYLLRVTVTDPSNGTAHSSSTPFAVGGATGS